MTALLTAAFTMGLLGSMHCVGMCGPLALSLPVSHNGRAAKLTGALLYNFGRITTYAAFGVVFGIIGKSLSLFGFQQWLSIILGFAVLLYIFSPKLFTGFGNNNAVFHFLARFRNVLNTFFAKKGYSSLYSIGLLNGLLPCGLVYMAVAGSVAAGGILHAVAFMAFFGLGTLPAMWSMAFFGNYITVSVRKKIKAAYPYILGVMACLLIVRGMGLGIPYISPEAVKEKAEVMGCCHNPEISKK